MTAFRFTLQKVLDWRSTQLELEELRFKKQAALLDALDRAYLDLQAAAAEAEAQVRTGKAVDGWDLAALGSFRLHMQAKQKAAVQRMQEERQALASQQTVMLEARRRCRLLDRLKERRWAEWEAAKNRELEELASDSFMAKWSRRQA